MQNLIGKIHRRTSLLLFFVIDGASSSFSSSAFTVFENCLKLSHNAKESNLGYGYFLAFLLITF